MRIIHTADWHLGNDFFDHDRTAEHRDFLDFLLREIKESEADALIVSGDIFDSPNPSAASARLYYDFLAAATEQNPGLQIVVTAGNHDSAARLEASQTLLKSRNVYIRGTLSRNRDGELILDDLLIPLHSRRDPDDKLICIAVPFLRSYDLPESESFSRSMALFFSSLTAEARHRYGAGERLIMAAHFYATGSEINEKDHSERIIVGGEENVDVSRFAAPLKYVALGHIHKAQKVGGNERIRYSGSALPMSFSERGYTHGVNVVDIDRSGEVKVTVESHELLRPLLSVPARGTVSVDDAIERIKALPQAADGSDNTRWPYVEIRLSTMPTGEDIRSIRDCFASRAALLCAVRNPQPEEGEARAMELKTEEQLRRLDPLELMRKIYSNKRGGEKMPEALEEKFRSAEKIAAELTDDE